MIELQGKPTPTIDHIHQLLTGERVGSALKVRFFRNNVLMEASITPVDTSPTF